MQGQNFIQQIRSMAGGMDGRATDFQPKRRTQERDTRVKTPSMCWKQNILLATRVTAPESDSRDSSSGPDYNTEPYGARNKFQPLELHHMN